MLTIWQPKKKKVKQLLVFFFSARQFAADLLIQTEDNIFNLKTDNNKIE